MLDELIQALPYTAHIHSSMDRIYISYQPFHHYKRIYLPRIQFLITPTEKGWQVVDNKNRIIIGDFYDKDVLIRVLKALCQIS